MCKTVAVMRRRSDSWLNATQILKVAGFDKPQRTRILEREVQKGEHEKVQGGYGKYQGEFIYFVQPLLLLTTRQAHGSPWREALDYANSTIANIFSFLSLTFSPTQAVHLSHQSILSHPRWASQPHGGRFQRHPPRLIPGHHGEIQHRLPKTLMTKRIL